MKRLQAQLEVNIIFQITLLEEQKFPMELIDSSMLHQNKYSLFLFKNTPDFICKINDMFVFAS